MICVQSRPETSCRSNFCWISTWLLGVVGRPPSFSVFQFLYHCTEGPTVHCQLQRMGRGTDEMLWDVLEIVKPYPRIIISKVLLLRRGKQLGTEADDVVLGGEAGRSLASSSARVSWTVCIWSPERALGLLMLNHTRSLLCGKLLAWQRLILH